MDSSRRIGSDGIRVFISYSRRNLEAADRLAAALEGEGFLVTIDRRDLPYGEEWLKELGDFIAGCDTVVALVTPAFLASKACNWELGQVRDTNKRLVPVMLERVPVAELSDSIRKIQLLPSEGNFDFAVHLKALADALNTDRQWIKEHTRLADRARQWIARDRAPALLLRGTALVDAEAWQDKQPKAAPPPSDEIFELMLASRRAATRRQRVIAAGSLLAAVFAFALAGAALFQWKRAEISYNAARTNLDLLIKDLAVEMQNKEGMPVSTVNRILKSGQTLAANLKNAGSGDDRLDASRAAMFYQFGKTYQKINQTAEAIKASGESLEIWRRLAASRLNNQDYQEGLAESLDLAGDLEREQKHFDKARELYGDSAKIGANLRAKSPENPDFAVSLSKTLVRIGDLDRFDKQWSSAKDRYSEAFKNTKGVIRLIRGEPSITLEREISWNYNKIGDVSVDLKDYVTAEASYRNSLCIRQHLLSMDQTNTQLQHDISWSFDKLAGAKLAIQEFPGALNAQFASLAIRLKLVSSDPKNLIWRRDAATALHRIGEIKAAARDFSSARMFFLAAAEARLELKKEVSGNTGFAAAFESSMKQAKEALTKQAANSSEVSERYYREAVAEEEQAAARKAAAEASDPAGCWNDILAAFRQGGDANHL